MMKNKKVQHCSDAGFTLVELAVVMIIIGLLIGGVLKGQQLITNAQVTATVAQVKGVDAATTTFRDMYNAMPGDMVTPQTRLQSCTGAPCNVAGDGNGRVDSNTLGVAIAVGSEEFVFWSHLAAADLITGIDGSNNMVWGQGLPDAEIGGGFHIGFTPNGNAAGLAVGALRQGHYLALTVTPGAAVNVAGNEAVTPNQAFRIDSKIDDGQPGTGSVQAVGAATCTIVVAGATVYNEAQDQVLCNLYIRIQG